jgi:hypothetical protein
MANAADQEDRIGIERRAGRFSRPVVQPATVRELLDQAGYTYDRVRDLPSLLAVRPGADDWQIDPDELYKSDPTHALGVARWVATDIFGEIHDHQRAGRYDAPLWTFQHLHMLCRAYAAEQLTIAWVYRQQRLDGKNE